MEVTENQQLLVSHSLQNSIYVQHNKETHSGLKLNLSE